MFAIPQFNLIDFIILGLLAYFIWTGYEQGLILGVLNFGRTIAAFALSLIYYPQFGDFLSSQFNVAKIVGQILGFILLLILTEIFLGFLIFKTHGFIQQLLSKVKPLLIVNKILGIIPSLAVGLILITTFTLLPLILPIGSAVKNPIENSWWGKNIIPHAISFEPTLEALFKRLPTRNLIYIVTREPQSAESISIESPQNTDLKVSEKDEQLMLEKLNNERALQGLNKLTMDSKLREVARAHSLDMFKRGYFSHYTPEGLSPFDRFDQAGIDYTLAGENLAYAPTVDIAHKGLMNSPGHRENILRAGFGKVGIGVIDASFYGKMFSQEFSN